MAIKKDDGAEAKYEETVAFIKENMKLVGDKDGPRYQMNKEHYKKFLANHGITTETVKQLSDAISDYNNGTVIVLKDLLKEEPKAEQARINTRTDNGVLSTRMLRVFHTKTPGTGEPITKYGTVTIKLNQKSRMDKALLDECSREIESVK